MPNILKYFSVIGILFIVYAVKAVEVNDLYLVKWPVAEQSKTALWKAALAGFKEVLIRKSGSQEILQSYEVQQAYSKVTSYLHRIEYKSQDTQKNEFPYVVSLYFEPRLIDSLIQDAKMPLWGANRPVTILWIAVEENFQRKILKDVYGKNGGQERSFNDNADEELSRTVYINAIRRGLPVISPLMDLEDELVVSISDIWGRFPSTILQASQRYSADSILIGRVKKDGEQWVGDFTYINQSNESTYQVLANESQQVIAKMMDQLAELLCNKYCVLEESGQKNQVLMNISGVNNFKNFKSVESYLNGLSGVKAARVMNIKSHQVLFELTLLGQVESVIEGIRLSQKLRVEEAPEHPQTSDKKSINSSAELIQENTLDKLPAQPIELLEQDKIKNADVDKTTDAVETLPNNDNQSAILYYRWLG